MNILDKFLDRIGTKDSNSKSQKITVENSKGISILQANHINFPPELMYMMQKQFSSADYDLNNINFHSDYSFSLEKPPLINIKTNREEYVREILDLLEDKTYLHIFGERGFGKTTFLLLLLEKLDKNCIWLNFKGQEDSQVFAKIQAAFYHLLNGENPPKNKTEFYKKVCNSLEKNTIIVLDDLPKDLDRTKKTIIDFVKICSKKNIKIISSSLSDVKSYFQDFLLDEFICEKLKPFSNYEIKELFCEYGAPERVTNKKFIEFIASIVNRNPTLIAAFIKHFSDNKWKLTNDEISALFNKDYAENIRNKYQKLLFETIENEKTKNLIYRLDLIGYKFNMEEVKLVSEIEPKIQHPFEKLNNLIDLWVQKDGDNYYISSVIKGLGELNLSSDVKKKEQYKLGKYILSQNNITPYEGIRVLGYFISANEYKEAGILLINLFNAFIENGVADDVWGVSSIYYNMPLPEEMDLTLKLVIRMNQIRLCKLLNKDINPIIKRIDVLFSKASLNEHAIQFYTIGLMAGALIAPEFPEKIHKYVKKGLEAVPKLKEQYGEYKELKEIVDNLPLHDIIWFTATELNSKKMILDWLNIIESLNEEVQKLIYKSDIAPEGCMIISKNLISRELEKNKSDQDWVKVYKDIKCIADKAFKMNFNLLWGNLIRELIELSDWKLNDLDKALKLGEDNLDLLSEDDPIIIFLIKDILGKRLYLNEKYKKAIKFLKAALNQADKVDIKDFPVFRIESYLYFSASQYKLKNQDIKLLLKYIDKALEIAKTNKYVPEIMLVKVLGEQAILQWLNDDLESAFYSTEEGIELLYKKKIQDDVWKSLFAIYGHMNGYLSVLAYSGSPPSKTGDGEDYVAPMPGLFISYSEESYKHYNISKKDLILIQIIWFAEGINDYKKAAYWAKKTYESLNNSNKKMIMGASIVLYPYLILDNKFNEAIKLVNKGFDLMASPKKVKAYNILIPLMFYISNISIKDTEKAITYSDKVKKICNNKEICNKNYSLKEGANLIYRVFNGEISFKELVTLGNKYNKQDEYVLGSISYIGATLKTCTPRDAINGHFAVYPLIEKIIQPNFKKSSAIIEKIIKEFFINYWNEKFENNKFRFRTPVLAEKEIYAKIRNEDIIKILQSIKKYL